MASYSTATIEHASSPFLDSPKFKGIVKQPRCRWLSLYGKMAVSRVAAVALLRLILAQELPERQGDTWP
jgi:hypothetical protein